jgi:hypothetical protein
MKSCELCDHMKICEHYTEFYGVHKKLGERLLRLACDSELRLSLQARAKKILFAVLAEACSHYKERTEQHGTDEEGP